MTQPTQTSSPYSYQSLSTAITRRRPLHRQKQQSNTTSMNEASQAENQRLKRSLSLTDLIFYGVGCSVGAGIYSLVGIGANLAGPGIALSFALCGVACIFTSLGYAEFAARVPLAGSAYTFTYVSFGELCGWLVGWNLTLGYAVSASVVARSWAAYLVGFVQGMLHTTEINGGDDEDRTITSILNVSKFLHWSIHAPLPNLFSTRDYSAIDNATITNSYECCPLAMLIIILCTLVLLTGAKESSRFNSAMTILNLSILGFVILAGTGSGTAFQVDNLTPVLPHGWQGVGRAAGLVFFSYLGFDMVSCLSEEVEHPERNMPIGIIGSLLSSMFIYCMVSIVVVGLAPVMLLGEDIPIVNALLANACCTHDEQVSAVSLDDSTLRHDTCLNYACKPILHSMLYMGSRIVSFGAIFGLTTACFACLMGQPRIFFSMAQDGLLFKIYAKVNPKTGVPTMGTILTGVFTALVACFIDLESLANAISLGTLQVFTFVNAGVIILRMTLPVKSWPNGSLALDDGCERWDLVRTQHQKQRQRHQDERTPLLPDHGGAEIVIDSTRKAQLVEMNSLSGDPAGRNDFSPKESNQAELRENGSWPHWLTFCFTTCLVIIFAISSHSTDEKSDERVGTRLHILLAILIAITLICAAVLSRLPQAPPPATFTCPCVPIIPLLGILCNSYMMGSLPLSTWYAIFLWLLVGICFYFGYGIHHSELRHSTVQNSAKTIPPEEPNDGARPEHF